jgi:hypothetical protein
LPGLDLDNFHGLAPLHQHIAFQAGLVPEEINTGGFPPVEPLLEDLSRGSMFLAIITFLNIDLCLFQSQTLN